MRAGELDLEHDAFLRDMPALHLDVKVRRRAEHRLVITAHAVETFMAFGPGRVVVEPAGAERRHETVEVVRVFESDVFLDLPHPASCRRVHGSPFFAPLCSRRPRNSSCPRRAPPIPGSRSRLARSPGLEN